MCRGQGKRSRCLSSCYPSHDRTSRELGSFPRRSNIVLSLPRDWNNKQMDFCLYWRLPRQSNQSKADLGPNCHAHVGSRARRRPPVPDSFADRSLCWESEAIDSSSTHLARNGNVFRSTPHSVPRIARILLREPPGPQGLHSVQRYHPIVHREQGRQKYCLNCASQQR